MDVNVPSWDEYFMDIARAVSARSKDPATKVGAVIINSRKHIIATGFNGMPPGFPETAKTWERPTKYNYVIHAEANCIAHATNSLGGCTMYSTMFPCQECAKLIAASGIQQVYYSDGKYENDIAWEIFASAQIGVLKV